MSYRSETIAQAIGQMNRQYFLPAIQREFVWKQEQIVQLFDSIMRGYPISSFLFWSVNQENRDKWQVYKFIERARQGGTHNKLVNTDGVASLFLALDGQQRLTSLMIGLKGVYEAKRKYARRSNADTWIPQRLYIDLMSDPRSDDEGREAGVYYKFEFLTDENPPPVPNATSYWYRVGQILDLDSQVKFESALDLKIEELESLSVLRSDKRIFERNFLRLYKAIHEDEVIAYYTEMDQDYDRVLDIFVRANEGGTKLSKSDLLLSMVTSNWEGMNARDEVFKFVDHLNSDLSRKNDFDKDFIMKSCLVLTDLPVVYKVENFNNKNLDLIRREWPNIKEAIQAGVNLINSFGVDRENLTSVNAIIPIMYFFFKNPGQTLLGTTPFEVKNSSWIRRWLIMVLLKGVFGRASDGLLNGIRSKIQATETPGADFPVQDINSFISQTGMTATFDDQIIDNILEMTYQGKQTFLALSLLYDNALWIINSHHQDHIFATNLFKKAGTPETDNLLQMKNRIGNLSLITASENMGKSDLDPSTWLESRDPSFLNRHLIPDDRSIWSLDQFSAFLEAREELIRLRFKALFDID